MAGSVLDTGPIVEAVTLIGGILGILLALDKVVSRIRKKPITMIGKRYGNQYYAYLIFNEPMALSSFTLDVFAGVNLLKKAFEKRADRLLMKPLDQITLAIDLNGGGSVEVELQHEARKLKLGSTRADKGILDSALVYEYLNKEAQINIGYLFKSPAGKLEYRLSLIKRRILKPMH